MLEELGRHDRADRVTAEILRRGMAAAIAEKAGERVRTARLERSAQHVDLSRLISHAIDLGCP